MFDVVEETLDPVSVSVEVRAEGWYVLAVRHGFDVGPNGLPQNGTLATWAVSFGYPMDPDSSDRVVRRIWADGRLVWVDPSGAVSGSSPVQGFTWTFYPGSEDQLQDPDMVGDNGADNTPAYRGQMYMVLKDFPLTEFECRIPSITAEIADAAYNLTDSDSKGNAIDSLMPVQTQLQLLANGQPWQYNGFADNQLDFDEDTFWSLDPDEIDMGNTGVIIDQQRALADVFNVYAQFYDFNFAESGAGVKFFRPVNGGDFTIAASIGEGDLLDDGSNQGNGCLMTTRADQGAIPSLMTVNYFDVSQQYQQCIQRARRTQFPQKSIFLATEANFAVPCICTASQALTGCSRALYRMAHEQLYHQFTLSPKFLFLEPGDVLQITMRTGKLYFVKITYISVQPDLSSTATNGRIFPDH